MSVQVDMQSILCYIRDIKLIKIKYPKVALNHRCFEQKQFFPLQKLYNADSISKDRMTRQSIVEKSNLADCFEPINNSAKRSFSNEFFSSWKAKSKNRLKLCRSFSKEGGRVARNSLYKTSSKHSSAKRRNLFTDPRVEISNLLFSKQPSVTQPKVQEYIRLSSKSPHKKHLSRYSSPLKPMPIDLTVSNSKIRIVKRYQYN